MIIKFLMFKGDTLQQNKDITSIRFLSQSLSETELNQEWVNWHWVCPCHQFPDGHWQRFCSCRVIAHTCCYPHNWESLAQSKSKLFWIFMSDVRTIPVVLILLLIFIGNSTYSQYFLTIIACAATLSVFSNVWLLNCKFIWVVYPMTKTWDNY